MNNKKVDKNELIAILIMGLFFVLIQGSAILLTTPFEETTIIEPVWGEEGKDDPINIVQIIVIMLTFTLIILLIAKYAREYIIQIIILGAIGYTAFFGFFLPIFEIILPGLFELQLILSILLGVLLVLILYKYPEWYIIDLSGVVIGIAAIIIFGISLGIFLILLLLIGLAIYDTISVYKTKHMIDLADTVMDLKLPVLLVVPKIRNYSLIKETKRLKQKLKEGEERDAFFMGLGDIVMPGILVVATYTSLPHGLPIALSVISGTLFGFAILMNYVVKGKPQAGLPCLCGGAIAGYLISSYLIFGEIAGLTLPSI